jgi:hypothetical protein
MTYVERQKRVPALQLPDDEYREEQQAHHERRNSLSLPPRSRYAAGERKGSEEEPKCDDHEQNTDDVELPKEGGEDTETLGLEGRAIVGESTGSAGLDLRIGQDADKEKARD